MTDVSFRTFINQFQKKPGNSGELAGLKELAMTVLTERNPARNNLITKKTIRREQIRRLSDAHLAELRNTLDGEARRRRKETAEGVHQDDPACRIRWWRPCPICHDRACRSQICREAERQITQRGRA
jgi:hypothetical protein